MASTDNIAKCRNTGIRPCPRGVVSPVLMMADHTSGDVDRPPQPSDGRKVHPARTHNGCITRGRQLRHNNHQREWCKTIGLDFVPCSTLSRKPQAYRRREEIGHCLKDLHATNARNHKGLIIPGGIGGAARTNPKNTRHDIGWMRTGTNPPWWRTTETGQVETSAPRHLVPDGIGQLPLPQGKMLLHEHNAWSDMTPVMASVGARQTIDVPHSIHAYGTYRKGLRHLAKRLKDGKPSSILRSAEILGTMLPRGALVIPMPAHTGNAGVMLQVAQEIARIRQDIRVLDILHCQPHGGICAAKRTGSPLPIPVMSLSGGVPNGIICVIDNVIDTGITFSSVLEVLPNAELYTIATTNKKTK